MIKKISWQEIHHVWLTKLWPDRVSSIEKNSAMNFLGGYSEYNKTTQSTFFGYFVNGIIAGVNSGHMCIDNQYRSRGLYVDELYRSRGIGTKLLVATIEQAVEEGAKIVWSIPRKSSWKTYQAAGFILASGWFATETSTSNAYCVLDI